MNEPVLKRRGVLVSRDDLPTPPGSRADATSVFNPGAVRWKGVDRLLLRVQARSRETHLYAATLSADAEPRVSAIAPEPIRFHGLKSQAKDLCLYHIYDPRLTVIDERVIGLFAVDTDEGCRLLTAQTDDFQEWNVLALDPAGDQRNGVLFPERLGGHYLRLERPNIDVRPGLARTGSEVILSRSSDLKLWDSVGPVFSGRPHYWDENVGPGTPPILTERGWLLLYHGVATHFAAANIYQMGAILLDRKDPTQVLARTRENILEPRTIYETTGQVPNVVFASGWIPTGGTPLTNETDRDAQPTIRTVWNRETTLAIYYGAADTCVASATTSVGRLLDALEDDDALTRES